MRITATFTSKCSVCGRPMEKGTEIEYDPGPPKTAAHIGCEPDQGLFDRAEAERLADRLEFKRQQF